MHWNQSGTPHLHAENLRQYQYRNHAAVETVRRDADHILELQVVAPTLRKERLDDENFHMLRSLLNSKQNIQSCGIKMNRHIKKAANQGIARNDINLTMETFKQEEIQAKQAQNLADQCHEKNYFGAASVFRQVADQCNALHSIHDQIMKLNDKEMDSDAEKQRQINLLHSIQQYESQYGTLKFRGNNLTKYRQDILNNHFIYDNNNNHFYFIS
ncbi:unnamed protein product [Rotaria sordida]|uniref:Uncharacterized protein n=2 Tax=Rotaria sordida TaxID=392033 RepID=A0A819JDX0_9BILA|nr:unnamed protein product [Rotaria sordida]CAF1376707.1 unnamed protein product [Rotaria sordida]CAF3928627.1 unnamed protein product [Rotaria sordida]